MIGQSQPGFYRSTAVKSIIPAPQPEAEPPKDLIKKFTLSGDRILQGASTDFFENTAQTAVLVSKDVTQHNSTKKIHHKRIVVNLPEQ